MRSYSLKLMPVIPTQRLIRKVEDRPKQIKRVLTLREFYQKRNKILILRGVGGLGDILMHRMMFEDFKRLAPDLELHFACPKFYHDAVRDHPFLDSVIDVERYDRNDYIGTYVTTTACGRYEMRIAPLSGDHRSDIWASHCGLTLTRHEMHFHLTESEKQEGRNIIEKHRDRPGPKVLLAPISAMQNKNLLPHQMLGVAKGLRDRGCYVFGLHNNPVIPFVKEDVPCIYGVNLRQWLGIVDQSDYVISVDTAAFHAAGGLKKPLIGIYTFADGLVYGKYFDFLLVQRHRKHNPEWTCGPCYNWGNCPKTKDNPKPCLTELTAEEILVAVDQMLDKWPVSDAI